MFCQDSFHNSEISSGKGGKALKFNGLSGRRLKGGAGDVSGCILIFPIKQSMCIFLLQNRRYIFIVCNRIYDFENPGISEKRLLVCFQPELTVKLRRFVLWQRKKAL